jgi:serine/threonine-protein kinase
MATPSSEFVLGRVVPGSRYRLEREVGRGGMGSVFEVEHVELGKRFVLKAVLQHRATGSDLVKRLREEWKALGRLEHPNIVSVTDAGATEGGVPYYVMERLVGEDLAGRLRRERRVPLRDAVRIGGEVLDALDAAHRIGVVHRDVKPSNVFLTQQGGAKLLDFGIAKLLDSDVALTRQGSAVGTPRYMSPEQVCGEAVDSRSDLYAVGLLLFEMLAGQSPFEGCSDRDVFEAHLNRTPPRVSRFVPEVPEELDRLLERLLAKEPSARPSSAGSAAAQLRALRVTLGSLPPEPPARSSRERFSRETIDAVRALLARTEQGPTDPEAPTLPAPDEHAVTEVDTRTEVLRDALDEVDTRTSAPAVATPPAERPASNRPRPVPATTWWGPSRLLVAGLLGGSLAVGLVVLAWSRFAPGGEDPGPVGSAAAPVEPGAPRPEWPAAARPVAEPAGVEAVDPRELPLVSVPRPLPAKSTPRPSAKPVREAAPADTARPADPGGIPRRRLPTSGL